MGVSVDTGGKSGKRPLDAELNLVPFIDLLVCCICFLLITAVWTKMARINVNQKGTKSPHAIVEPPDTPPIPKLKVAILIGEEGHTITAGPQRLVIDKRGSDYDYEALGERLKEIQELEQEKDVLRVMVEDGIAYQYIVRTMDIAIAEGFPDIRMSDSSAAM